MASLGRTARNTAGTAIGGALMAAGVIGVIIPLPLGAPLIMAGMPLLVMAHKPSRLGVSWLRHKYDAVEATMNFLHKPTQWKYTKNLTFSKNYTASLKLTDPKLYRRYSIARRIEELPRSSRQARQSPGAFRPHRCICPDSPANALERPSPSRLDLFAQHLARSEITLSGVFTDCCGPETCQRPKNRPGLRAESKAVFAESPSPARSPRPPRSLDI